MILPIDKDPMGHAIYDYYTKGKAGRLCIFSSMFDEDEMPVAHLFRSEKDMNRMEQIALGLCRGRVLDVGAGAGCHALPLQDKGLDVTAIDISRLAVETQRARGVVNTHQADFFTDELDAQFDTILMLMNGIGICGIVERLPQLFARLDTLLAPDGCLLADSSDLSYIYEDENGCVDLSGVEGYYGEVDFRMQYGDIKGLPFHWLYVDFDTLSTIASAAGYHAEMVCKGDYHDYLAKITRVK